MTLVPVLEVGGTHVTAAWVDTGCWQSVLASRSRRDLPSAGSAEEIITSIAACARLLGPLSGSTLGVAIPGPFDYARGIGRFHGVSKLDSLDGLDVGHAILEALPDKPSEVRFLNDAAAFALGEWVSGAARSYERVAALTLGTGVGSAFLESGQLVTRGAAVPPEGRADLLQIGNSPLEDVVSRRAIVARYAREATAVAWCGSQYSGDLDVRGIAERARDGDPAARSVLHAAFSALGTAIAPWLLRFSAQLLVVGGSIATSWDLVAPPLRRAIAATCPGLAGLPVARAHDLAGSAEVGAAWHAVTSTLAKRARRK